jgi:hypothetical protein
MYCKGFFALGGILVSGADLLCALISSLMASNIFAPFLLDPRPKEVTTKMLNELKADLKAEVEARRICGWRYW